MTDNYPDNEWELWEDEEDEEYFDYDDYYDNVEYETEETYFYEWHGHFFYDKPTLKQKILAILNDIRYRIERKLGRYDDIPF